MNNLKQKLSSLLFFLSIMMFIIAFNFSDNPVGNWYQQFMPNLNGRPISDVTFVDSLNGYAVTGDGTVGDTNYVLKTTNGGDNWSITFQVYRDLSRMKFLNVNTGYICGGYNASCSYLAKTIDGGFNWTPLNVICNLYNNDMAVLNEDTIWLVDRDGLVGGVFRTTNGGASWQNQLSLGSQNPTHIYMFNQNIGFASQNTLYKTTNSGLNWFPLTGGGFFDMYFVDSLTGWGIFPGVKKTTDGGLNWVTQTLPYGGNILGNGANKFMNRKADTIWAVGESIIVGGSPPTRGIIFRTTNGGNNWLFQLPDTSIHINRYLFGQFVNRQIGWAYSFNPTGIHTTNGGDPIFYTAIEQISSEVPKKFQLFQNYPNPFNSSSKFKVQITSNVKHQTSDVKVKVFDIIGREVSTVLDQKLAQGEYEITFDAKGLTSGVYFYSLFVGGNLIDTKKMMLVK